MSTDERHATPRISPTLSRKKGSKRLWHLLKPWVCTFILLGVLLVFVTQSLGPAFGIVLGPYAGGGLRDWQSCCAKNSHAIAPFALAGVALVLLIQALLSRSEYFPRLFAHLAAWVAPILWFLSAVLSYAHALE